MGEASGIFWDLIMIAKRKSRSLNNATISIIEEIGFAGHTSVQQLSEMYSHIINANHNDSTT